MNRRTFLGGLVATATMAEAGALAEFMEWLRRKPVTTVGKNLMVPIRFYRDAYMIGDRGLLDIGDIVSIGKDMYQISDIKTSGVIGRKYGFEWYES